MSEFDNLLHPFTPCPPAVQRMREQGMNEDAIKSRSAAVRQYVGMFRDYPAAEPLDPDLIAVENWPVKTPAQKARR